MTPRSLFAIIIKVIGIYLVMEAIVLLPEIISTIYQYGRIINTGSQQDILGTGFFVLFALSLYFTILRYSLFKTDWIIDKLHLEHGFTEEKFELNIHRSTVLKIAVIAIGAVMIIDSLPLLCKQAFSYLQTSSFDIGFKENRASGWLIYYFAKFSIGFAMISASRPIVNLIERKRKGPATIKVHE